MKHISTIPTLLEASSLVLATCVANVTSLLEYQVHLDCFFCKNLAQKPHQFLL